MSYEFTKRDVDNATQEILDTMLGERNFSPVESPKLYLLGGQPGAGKSTISDRLMTEYPNTIFINPDTYRELHPQYEAIKAELKSEAVKVTGVFSGAVTEQVLRTLAEQKYNLIIEGTFRTLEVPQRTTEGLREKGDTAELHVIAVPKDISYVGTLDRYFVGKTKGTGRAVNKEHYDLVVKNLPENLKALAESGMFQSMHLHTREKEIFSTERDADTFMKQFHREIGRRLDLVQGKDLADRIDFINQCLTNEEKNGVTAIAKTPIAEIRKELQSIQKSRNINAEQRR